MIDELRRHMLDDDDAPTFANWDRDQTAIDARYAEQEPALVSAQLVAAAEQTATAFEGVGEGALDRVGLRSDGATFTVESLARCFIHDPVDHLQDVRRTRTP